MESNEKRSLTRISIQRKLKRFNEKNMYKKNNVKKKRYKKRCKLLKKTYVYKKNVGFSTILDEIDVYKYIYAIIYKCIDTSENLELYTVKYKILSTLYIYEMNL